MFHTCCTSRLGGVKASYATREAAMKEVKRVAKKYQVPMEPYPCEVNRGRFHVRKARRLIK